MKKRDIKTLFPGDKLRQRFVSKDFSWNDYTGREALIILDEVEKPRRIQKGDGWMTISDVGYLWYQLALREQNWWLSAAYNEKGELLELYFDITAGNDFSDPVTPSFVDMYLDVIVSPSGKVTILDRDELDAAFASGVINQEAYTKAIADCERLYLFLCNHTEETIHFCKDRVGKLLPCCNDPS